MLDARDLHVSYGVVPAIRGVSLTVSAGERVAIVGRNGAGKTTTLRAIAGLNPPTQGRIVLDGEDVTASGPAERLRRGVALVPEGRGVFPDLSVRENLAMGALRRRLSRDALDGEIERVCEHFPRLTERWGQAAGSLSGGEQQMLVVARGLMSRPRLLVLDEPSLGLAPLVVAELYKVLGQLAGEGLAVLVVEQYVELALRFTHRAYVLDKGRVALEGNSTDLLADPSVIDVYLAAVEAHAPHAGPDRRAATQQENDSTPANIRSGS